MDERAAFERAIDENPLDATNHLVYADWLDEHSEHDEAAFRRAMGEWFGGAKAARFYAPGTASGLPWRMLTFNQGIMPRGVNPDRIPLSYGHYTANDRPGGSPEHHATVTAPGVYNWPTYRGMETALRGAFTPPRTEQLSRRRISRRRYTLNG